MNLRVLIFSKDRPLQLRACLESFFRATRCDPTLISILSPSYQDYGRVQTQFPTINWLTEEGDFNRTLRKFLSELPPDGIVLIDVDDQVWLREVDLPKACEICNTVDGFSLRLGRSIPGKRCCEEYHELYMTWHWRGSESVSTWGYPFGMGTLYPTRFLSPIMDFTKHKTYRLPNDWEAAGVRWMSHNHNEVFACYLDEGNRLALPAVVSPVVNVVRRPTRHWRWPLRAEVLLEAEKKGYRQKWETMWGKEYPDCFTDGKDWELEKSDEPQG